MIQNIVIKNTTRGCQVDVGCRLARGDLIPIDETTTLSASCVHCSFRVGGHGVLGRLDSRPMLDAFLSWSAFALV
jgi:hypothetical protein